MTLDEPGIRHQRGSLCRCLGETWTAPTPRPTRPQRGQPHVDGPLGGAFLIPRPLAVVDYWQTIISRTVILLFIQPDGRPCPRWQRDDHDRTSILPVPSVLAYP